MADLVYPPVILVARGVFQALGIRMDIQGTRHVPAAGGAVLASNHISYLDFILCGFAAQPANRLVRFMAKSEVFSHPVSGPLMRGMHHINVDRDAGAASYSTALDALTAGNVVGVFPEATISRAMVPKEFKSGAARLAAAAGTPLIPMAVWGGQRMWTKERSRRVNRNLPITVRIGEPLHPARDDDPVEVTKELKTRVEALVDQAIEAYPVRPGPGEEPWWLPARLGGSAPTLAEAATLEQEATAKRRARRAAQAQRAQAAQG